MLAFISPTLIIAHVKKTKAGWKAAGITDNLENARQSNINPIKDNPFK